MLPGVVTASVGVTDVDIDFEVVLDVSVDTDVNSNLSAIVAGANFDATIVEGDGEVDSDVADDVVEVLGAEVETSLHVDINVVIPSV